jgi:hypothetical protein
LGKRECEQREKKRAEREKHRSVWLGVAGQSCDSEKESRDSEKRAEIVRVFWKMVYLTFFWSTTNVFRKPFS